MNTIMIKKLYELANTALPKRFHITKDCKLVGVSEHGSKEYYAENAILENLAKEHKKDGVFFKHGYTPFIYVDKRQYEELYLGIFQ